MLVVALMMPVLVGTAGLGTEVVWWLYKHKNMQSAADSGAVSAATAGSNLTVQANSVTASYGYANGVNNVTVTVNQPPTLGNFTTNTQAVEVIVRQPQPRLLSALFGVAYAGFGILVALRTRNVQATQSSFLLFFPLLFLTPNFVPIDRLTSLMQTLARLNPVTYVLEALRSLILQGWVFSKLWPGILVIVVMGVGLTGLCVHTIETYDR